MKRGGKSRWAPAGVCVLAAALVAGAPIPASAAPDEYDLLIPSGGNEGSGSEDPAATTPVAPATTVPTTPTTSSIVPTDPVTGEVVRKKQRKPEPEPVFGSTSVNATLGPQRIPPLRVGAADSGIPVLPAGLAILAAGCCGLAVWRLRYLRELPTAPRPQTASVSARPALASARRGRPASGTPSLS